MNSAKNINLNDKNWEEYLWEIDNDTAIAIYGGIATATLPLPKNIVSGLEIAPERAKNNRVEQDWSEPLQAILDRPAAKLPLYILMGGIAFTGSFSSWAYFAPIQEVSQAQGKLIPAGETYKIQPLDAGKTIKVLVKEGQQVQAGQILVELDTELAQKEIERFDRALSNYQVELGQKQALIEKARLEIRTTKAITGADILAQRSTISLAQEKASTTRKLIAQLNLELQAYQQRKEKTQPISSLSQARLQQLKQELAANQERLARLIPLQEEGAISQEVVFQAQQQLWQAEQQLNQSKMQELSATNEQLFQAEQNIRDLETRITTSQGELTSTLKEIQRLQAELTQKQAQGENLQLANEQKIRQLQLEITQFEGKIAETKNFLLTAKAKLKNNYLKAPVDGVVLSLNLKNTGEVLQPGQTIAEIAPKGTPLVLSAIIPSSQAGFVQKGMEAKVKLDAYPYQDYGIISGKVSSISADAKADEKLGNIYQIKIELDRNYVTDDREKIDFKPGQTATADIITRDRKVMDLLLDPIKKLKNDNLVL